MGLLRLLPASLKLRLLLSLLSRIKEDLAAKHLGQHLRDYLDSRFGKDLGDPVQAELASYLELVAKELRG